MTQLLFIDFLSDTFMLDTLGSAAAPPKGAVRRQKPQDPCGFDPIAPSNGVETVET
jgi:hypothetical protein